MITLRTSLTGVFLVSADCLLGLSVNSHPTQRILRGKHSRGAPALLPPVQARRYEWVSSTLPGAGGDAETQEEEMT